MQVLSLGGFRLDEVLMRRFPNNVSESELRAYRRWAAGLYLSYLIAIIVAFGLTFANRPTSDLRASNETQTARSEAASGTVGIHTTARPASNP